MHDQHYIKSRKIKPPYKMDEYNKNMINDGNFC